MRAPEGLTRWRSRRSARLAGATVVQAGERRSARIESLRALAALGVLVGHTWGTAHHYSAAASKTYLDRLIFGGGFGVFLFFALSGYLLYWPFARRTFTADAPIDLRRYARNRALRILPLYYVTLAVVLVWQHGGGTAHQWLLFATFTQNFDKETLLSVNGVTWSVVVELQFYVVLPALALLVSVLARGSLARGAAALGALALGSFALRWHTFYALFGPTSEPPGADQALRYSLPSTFFFFSGGMLLCLLRLAWERRPAAAPAILRSAWTWLTASVLLWALLIGDFRLEYVAAPASFLLLAACVLPLHGTGALRLLDWKPVAAVGIVSYSLYMWHIPILTRLGDASWAPTAFAGLLPVAAAISLAVAFASYRLAEAPFLAFRRQWGARAAAGAGEAGGGD